jgi:hypothetical protein
MKDDRPEQLPLARTEQLIVKEVDDEVLVYDLANDKAHCLNDTAARVWKSCDGKNSVTDISTSLAKEAGVAIDEGVVWLALDQLKKFKLLEQVPTAPTVFAGMSRRQLMRSLGVAAIALPVIISIAAPTAEAQASCAGSSRPNQCPCGNDGQCASNHCVGGKCCPTTSPC